MFERTSGNGSLDRGWQPSTFAAKRTIHIGNIKSKNVWNVCMGLINEAHRKFRIIHPMNDASIVDKKTLLQQRAVLPFPKPPRIEKEKV